MPTIAEYVPGLALDWERLPDVSDASPSCSPPNGIVPTDKNVGVSREVLEFVVNGAPVGQQRGMSLRAGRSFLEVGKSIEETSDLVWRGLQASPVGDDADPWTQEHARAIDIDLANREPTPLEERPKPMVGRQDWTSQQSVAEAAAQFARVTCSCSATTPVRLSRVASPAEANVADSTAPWYGCHGVDTGRLPPLRQSLPAAAAVPRSW